MEILSFPLAPFWIKWILVKRVNSCGVAFVLVLMFKLPGEKKKKKQANIVEPALKRRRIAG